MEFPQTEKENRKSLRIPSGVFRRRRKTAFLILLGLLALGYYYWANAFSGRIVLIQEATAEEITRGKLFGPFFVEGFGKNSYFYRINLPLSPQVFEMRLEFLDEHLRVIHPQSDFLITGQEGLTPGDDYHRRGYFKLRTSGSYYIRLTQVNGTYPSGDIHTGNSPVVRMIVKTNLVEGWTLWLPIVIIVALGVAMMLAI